MLTAGLILAIMILPFISRDLARRLRDRAAGAEGSRLWRRRHTWEVMRNVVVPYTRRRRVGGVMLALGRALGETMAVTFVIGNAHKISRLAARARHDDLRDHRQ